MTSRLNRITQQRLQKLDRIRARGGIPYPWTYHRTHTTKQAVELLQEWELKDDAEKEADRLAGKVRAMLPDGLWQ